MDPITLGVDALLKLIPSAWEKLQNELKLVSDAKREFDILKEFIGDIRLIINEAYSKEVINERLKPCIKRMREILYDSEDAIEDLLRRESKCKRNGVASALRHVYNKRTFTVESRVIKQMWEDYIAKLGITTRTRDFLGLPINHVQFSLAGHRSSSNAFLDKTDALVGTQGPMNRLVQLLIENPLRLKVIFVHGAQGVGKTSLVGAMLRDQSVRLHFNYCVWIEDLRSCELADNTAEALMKADVKMWDLTVGEVNNQGSPVALEEAFRLMKEKNLMANNFSWALVLDDASRADVFESLQADLIETRPSVLVTTQVRSLASSSTDYLRKAQYDSLDFEHVSLSENDSRSLFFRKMEDTYEDLPSKCENSRRLKNASDLILRRCKGLPLAILATCRLLRNNKLHGVTGTTDAVKWTDLSGRLEEKLLSKGHVVYPNGRKITLRMDCLIDVRCLFHLSIFPLDRPIRCSTMMRLWMAEGFIKDEGGQPVQENAEETLEKLLDHNVIQGKKTSCGRVKTGRVHNLLHQIIVSKSNDEDLAMIVAGRVERLPENVRYLSFHSPMGKIDAGTSVKGLRSLHVFKRVHLNSLEELLEKVERLKVLDLQSNFTKEEKKYPQASLDTFPLKILRLTYLRYLSLRGTNINKIPEGIKDLTYLETLDLKSTLVNQLPDGILKLTALRHLLVSSRSNRRQAVDTDPKFGVKAPSKLGVLTSLQKLCMIELEPVKQKKWWKKWKKSGRVQFLEKLGNLANLQRLGISMLKSTDVKLLCSSILKLTNLEALRLIAAPGEKIDLSKKGMGQALKCLQRLHLTGCLGTLPRWILRSDILIKLVLKRSQLTVDALQKLGELSSLKHLELEQAFDVTDMKFEATKFQELRFLGLDGFDKLKSIQVDEGALPTLERLSLARCNSLTSVPLFIRRHTKLKCLELCGMPEDFNEAVKVLIKELRERMKVKFKEWKDPAEEEAITLPKRPAGNPSAPGPFMKQFP